MYITHSLAWSDCFFPFFFVVEEKRVWNSLQPTLVLALLYGTGSVNKRNMIHKRCVSSLTSPILISITFLFSLGKSHI